MNINNSIKYVELGNEVILFLAKVSDTIALSKLYPTYKNCLIR